MVNSRWLQAHHLELYESRVGGRYEELQLPVGSSQVDAKAANLGGQQKHKDVIIAVEVIDQPRAYPNICGTVHPVIPGNQNKLQPSDPGQAPVQALCGT